MKRKRKWQSQKKVQNKRLCAISKKEQDRYINNPFRVYAPLKVIDKSFKKFEALKSSFKVHILLIFRTVPKIGYKMGKKRKNITCSDFFLESATYH